MKMLFNRNIRLNYNYLLVKYILHCCSIIPIQKGGEIMDKDPIKSFVAGLGIASLVAGISIAAPTHAAQSG